MKRLSLAELKEQSAQQVTNNLEAIKGGVVGDCHCQTCEDAWQLFLLFLEITPFHT
ncbi:hypothetical protein [Spirosoma linguale]|uniref:hypothetical protein n=1 Tax=Spirosoma linguale TaxID=108 RepID=UPI003CC7DC54